MTKRSRPFTSCAVAKASSQLLNPRMRSPMLPSWRAPCRKRPSCWSISRAAATRTCIPLPSAQACSSEMSRIQARFASLASARRKALIPYITAGDPHPALTVPLLRALVEAGADILELGVPFSDPMADGPVIQRSAERALKHGTGLSDVLKFVVEFRKQDAATPIVLMGYANPIEAMGSASFLEKAKAADIDGVIVVDYPPEECVEFSAVAKKNGIDSVFLLAPTSTEKKNRVDAVLLRYSGEFHALLRRVDDDDDA